MIKHIIAIMVVAASATASAQVTIERNTLGSGTPGMAGFENAESVLQNDIYHAPQYMPQYPTAGTIWPRVVEVPCVYDGYSLKCEGYNWTPKMGRGEYLFFKPRIVEPVKPQVIIREHEVIKEVPPKKIRQ